MNMKPYSFKALLHRSRLYVLLASLTVLAACARPFGSGNDFELKKPVPNPAAVVAAEIGLQQSIARNGLAKALHDTASEDARVFAPQLVTAQAAFKSGAAINAQTASDVHDVYMSCDGKLAAVTGIFQLPGGSTATFTNIWRREYDTRGGSADWRWVLRMEGAKQTAFAEPEYVQTRIASCNGDVPAASPALRELSSGKMTSPDRSLIYSAASGADGKQSLLVSIWNGTVYDTVTDSDMDAAKESAQ